MKVEGADDHLGPVPGCIGDMGYKKACYILSNTWFGAANQVLKMEFKRKSVDGKADRGRQRNVAHS